MGARQSVAADSGAAPLRLIRGQRPDQLFQSEEAASSRRSNPSLARHGARKSDALLLQLQIKVGPQGVLWGGGGSTLDQISCFIVAEQHSSLT